MSYIKRVLDWLSVSDKNKTKEFKLPSKEKWDLYRGLMEEELDEGEVALNNKDEIEFRDAIIDQFYIFCNIMYFSGYTLEMFEKDFKEIEKSNWSKYCKNAKEAIETVKLYKEGRHPDKIGKNIDCYIEAVSEDLWIVRRSSDNKIMKSYLYKPAKLK